MRIPATGNSARIAATAGIKVPRWIGIAQACASVAPSRVNRLAEALGLDTEAVNSPSYTIVNEYLGERPLFHFDLYRVQDPSELYEIGWDDYLERQGLIVVEWGDRAAECLPREYYMVDFQIIDDQTRQIDLAYVTS